MKFEILMGGGRVGVLSMISYLTGGYFVKISSKISIFVACRKNKQVFD